MALARGLGVAVRPLLPVAGLVLVTASCGVRPAAGGPAQPSGSATLVFGTVEASPGCPVAGHDHACRPRPVGHVLVAGRPLPAGVTVRTRTRADGHFSLRLTTGRYVLAAATGQVFPRCSPVPIVITSLAPVRADIHCDSGIR